MRTADNRRVMAIAIVSMVVFGSLAVICHIDEDDADGLTVTHAYYCKGDYENTVVVDFSEISMESFTFTIKKPNGDTAKETSGQPTGASFTINDVGEIKTSGYKVLVVGGAVNQEVDVTVKIEYTNADSTNTTEYLAIGSDLKDGQTVSGKVFDGWYNGLVKIDKATHSMNVHWTGHDATDHSITVTVRDSNYGTATASPTAAKYGTTVNLTATANTGYRFYGWASDDVDIVNNSFSMPDKDVSVIAEFVKVYTITYHLYGGTNSPDNPPTYIKNEPVNFKDATRAGYSFDGWYDSDEYKNRVQGTASYEAGTNIDVYAKWTAITYSISYKLYDGTNYAGAPESYTVESDTITLGTPTKTDNAFIGWYGESTYTNKITQIPKGSTGNLDLHARWSGDCYTISYELYGGTNYAGAPTFFAKNTEDITLGTPTKIGYTFAGWFLEKEYTNEIKVITKSIQNNITLHAKWMPITYTISYTANGGSLTGGVTNYTIESGDIVLAVPTKYYCTFAGWFDNPELSGDAIERIVRGSYGDRSFYAKWTDTEYKITYVLDGGSHPEGPKTYTYSPNPINIGTPTKSGSVFAGWYTNAQFTGDPVTGIEAGASGDKTFYAKWTVGTQYKITVTYKSSEGIAFSNLNKAVKGTTVTLTAYPNDGYKLDKWESGDVTVDNGKFVMPEKDVSINAVFKSSAADKYDITVNYDSSKGTASSTPAKASKGDVVTLNAIAKSGYALKGWVTSDVAIYDDCKFVMPDRPVTVQAEFVDSSKLFTVTLESNDITVGSVNMTKISVYEGTTFKAIKNVLVFSDGQKVTATPKTITQTDKVSLFTGWSKESGTIYNNNTKVTALFEVQNIYDTRTVSTDSGFKVSGGGIRYDAQLTVESQTFKQSDWSGIDSRYYGSDYARLVYEIGLGSPTGEARNPVGGSLNLTFAVDSKYNGETAVVFHKETSGIKNVGTSIVSGGQITVVTSSLSPFLVVLPTDISVTGVTLDSKELNMKIGSTHVLKATVIPSDAAVTSVTWKSSNTAVATVDSNGKITAVAEGKATITVTTDDGGKTDACSITVQKNGTPLIIVVAFIVLIAVIGVMMYMRNQDSRGYGFGRR